MQIVIVIFDYKTVSVLKKHLVIALSFSLISYERKASRKRDEQCHLLLNFLHNFLDSVSVSSLKPFSLLVLKMLSSGGRSPTKVTKRMQSPLILTSKHVLYCEKIFQS